MIRDVMVFTPVYRLADETVAAVMRLEWDGPLTFVLQRDNPHTAETEREAGVMNHLHQYQRGRELFLRGDCDAMLIIEDDMIPPPDTLQKLAALDTDVAYGVYVYRHGPPEKRVVNILRRYYAWPEQARNMGESISFHGHYADAVKRGVIDCSGSGLGCTLVKRHVIEALPFEAAEIGGFFDWEWTQAVYNAPYRMMADMSVKAGHRDRNTAEVLWPS